MRRLPIYLLLDCSESMVGEPLEAVQLGVQYLQETLRKDPIALETAFVSVINFSGKARQTLPLTEMLQFTPPKLSVGPGTGLGNALDLLSQCIQKEVRKSTPERKGDWKPIAFLLTDGTPTDSWKEALTRLKVAVPSLSLVALGCGTDVDMSVLQALTPQAYQMSSVSADSMKVFFKWVSASIQTTSSHLHQQGKEIQIAPLPPEIQAINKSQPARESSQLILAARCQKSKQVYLMRYRKSGSTFQAEKSYPVGPDYLQEAKAAPSGANIDSSQLKGSPPCPYCGNPGWKPSPDPAWLECSEKKAGGNDTQVMFVLDVTGSMSGEIDGVKNNITDFMDYIHSEKLNAEVGIIAFRALHSGELPEIMRFDGSLFTKDANKFKKVISRLIATGGGGPGESSPDALVLASKQSFRKESTKIFILISDQPPQIPDGRIRSLREVSQAMKNAQIQQLYIVVPDSLTSAFRPLLDGIKGQFFNLDNRGGDSFRKILLDIGQSISVNTRLG
ncbi:MAG: VWA domain-containing protein [SAR324 cluster bacterium]|nr:VWA domain-containing protein [SAR324 cluster bacterium]